MKKIFIISLFIAVIPAFVLAEVPETQKLALAEKKVDALFNNLRSVSNKNTSNPVVSKIKYDFEGYFESAEQHCPNEFKNIWRKNEGVTSLTTDIRPARYFDLFFQIFRDPDYHNCTFNYESLNSCVVKEPEFKKNEAPAKLAQVVVRKVYSRNGTPFAAFNDTLVVGLEAMKIRAWANNTSKHSIGYFGGDVLDVEQLKVSAALAYNRKQYSAAYQIYQTIVSKYPEEGDPYYRMAIMLYKKDYGWSLNKRTRQKLILDYLDKAIRYGSYSTRHCADNMRYWLTC